MAKVHFAIGGKAVACGAETSWNTRGYQTANLPKDRNPALVSCKRCKATWQFGLAEVKALMDA